MNIRSWERCLTELGQIVRYLRDERRLRLPRAS